MPNPLFGTSSDTMSMDMNVLESSLPSSFDLPNWLKKAASNSASTSVGNSSNNIANAHNKLNKISTVSLNNLKSVGKLLDDSSWMFAKEM